MKKLLCFLCGIIAVAVSASAELIPAARLTDWTPGTKTGVIGGIPTNRTTLINVTQAPYNADNTGATDATAAIQLAVNAASTANNGSVVYLPAGNYKMLSAVSGGLFGKNFTVRGDGPAATILNCASAANQARCLSFGNGSQWNYPAANNTVTSGNTQGSTTITIADASPFAAGNMMRFEWVDQQDTAAIAAGAVPVKHTFGLPYTRRQVVWVTAATATTVTFTPAIYHDPAGLSARVFQSGFVCSGIGVEDLKIVNTNANAFSLIEFGDGRGNWIKNCKLETAGNYAIYLYCQVQSEVRHCSISGPNNGTSNHAGILTGSGVSGCLIEDNIIVDMAPNIEVNQNTVGCAFLYNLCDAVMNINHGPHNSFNLYEGNSTASIQSDGYYGSESEQTIFRNWVRGKLLNETQYFTLSVKRFSRKISIVGNLLGNTASPYSDSPYQDMGQPNMGNSNSNGTATPSAGDFWDDWKATGTLTTRSSATSGTITLNGSATNFTGRFRSFVTWGGGAIVELTNVVASTPQVFTFTSSVPLPAQGTALTYEAGTEGYQERDLDVFATSVRRVNRVLQPGNAGIPSGEELGADTLPESLAYRMKPAFFGSLAWPPYSYTSTANPSATAIPAAYRYINGKEVPSGVGDTVAPSVPTGVVAVAGGATQVNLSWTASTDNVGVTGYRVERSQGAGSVTYALVGTPGGTSYSDTGLITATVYNYRVRAIDGNGNTSGYSSVVRVTAANSPTDATVPTVPQNLVAVVNGATQISLSWSASTDNVGVVGYRMERSQGAGSTAFAEITPPAAPTTGDSGLTPSTVYNYRLRAVDAAGNLSGYSNVATAKTTGTPDTTFPSVPTGTVAVAAGAMQVNLSWVASTDNVGVTGYRVERSQGAGSTAYTQVAAPTGVSFGDTGLTASTIYNYRVQAVDAAGNLSGYSGVATATTGAPSLNGLVAAFAFEESSGSSVTDSSGNGNTGAITGATRTAQGKFGRALAFNGVDNVVVVNNSPSLDLTSLNTLSAWVYPTTSQSGWRTILHKDTDAWYLHAGNPDGAMQPAAGAIFNGGEKYVGGPTALPLNVWTHLATTYDGAALRLYVNGTEVANRPMTGTIEANSMPLRIGGNTYQNQFFAGKIDEIRIYNRALTPTEVQADMNTPVGAPKAPSGLRISGP